MLQNFPKLKRVVRLSILREVLVRLACASRRRGGDGEIAPSTQVSLDGEMPGGCIIAILGKRAALHSLQKIVLWKSTTKPAFSKKSSFTKRPPMNDSSTLRPTQIESRNLLVDMLAKGGLGSLVSFEPGLGGWADDVQCLI